MQRDARPLLQFPSDAGQRWRGSDGVQLWVSRRRTGGQRKEEEEEGGGRGYGKGAGTGGREGVTALSSRQRRWTTGGRKTATARKEREGPRGTDTGLGQPGTKVSPTKRSGSFFSPPAAARFLALLRQNQTPCGAEWSTDRSLSTVHSTAVR